MKIRPDITVIILNYNTKDLTLRCLSALEKTKWGKLTYETIIVDNASWDGSIPAIRKQYPKALVVENKTNVGFAKGNNVGLAKATGRYILLLNSDTECENDAISAVVAFMDSHPKAGAATCKLVLSDGTMDPACHRGFPTPWNAFTYYAKLEALFPKTKWFGGYHAGYKHMDSPHEVDVISGAFFLIRREVLQTVGYLDESFFMYAEDIDWAYRIKQSGWQIWFIPTAKVLHIKKQSGRAHASSQKRRESERHFLLNNKLFYQKHYETVYPEWVTWLVYRAFDLQLFLVKIL